MDDSNKLAGEGTPPAQGLMERMAIIDGTFRILRLITWFAGLIGLSYVTIALPVSYSAGQETTIHLVYEWLLAARVHVLLSIAGNVTLFILWRRERMLRKSSIHREHQRVEELEVQKDPNRTSSGLEE